MGNLQIILDALREDRDEAVLATIVQVEGSAYRKAGASMLFKKNGERVGLLSGGCGEEDFRHRISELGDQLTSVLIPYDMRAEDDMSWGMGAGCNGVIHIHAERITQEKRRTLIELGTAFIQAKLSQPLRSLTPPIIYFCLRTRISGTGRTRLCKTFNVPLQRFIFLKPEFIRVKN